MSEAISRASAVRSARGDRPHSPGSAGASALLPSRTSFHNSSRLDAPGSTQPAPRIAMGLIVRYVAALPVSGSLFLYLRTGDPFPVVAVDLWPVARSLLAERSSGDRRQGSQPV